MCTAAETGMRRRMSATGDLDSRDSSREAVLMVLLLCKIILRRKLVAETNVHEISLLTQNSKKKNVTQRQG